MHVKHVNRFAVPDRALGNVVPAAGWLISAHSVVRVVADESNNPFFSGKYSVVPGGYIYAEVSKGRITIAWLAVKVRTIGLDVIFNRALESEYL